MHTPLKSEPVTIESLHDDCVALEERLYRIKAQRDALLAAARSTLNYLFMDKFLDDPANKPNNVWAIRKEHLLMLRAAIRLAESD